MMHKNTKRSYSLTDPLFYFCELTIILTNRVTRAVVKTDVG